MSTVEQPVKISALDEVRQLKLILEDVATGLKNQSELLRVRGMNLPPGALQSVGNLQANLARLELALSENDIELAQLRSLVATSALINSSLDFDTVLADAMEQITVLTGAERGYILLRNWTTDELEFRIAREADGTTPGGKTGAGVSSTILNVVLTSGEPMLTDNAFKDPRMKDSETIANFVLRSVLCVPLKYKDQMIGAVYVDNRFRSGVFTERELALLTAFANYVAVAVENARLYANVQSTLAEITEIKELIENVFRSIASGVITTDAADTITTVNAAAANIFRLPEDAEGHALATVLPPIAEDFDTVVRSVRDEGTTATLEAQPDVPDRGTVVIKLKLSPLRDARMNTQGVAMVVDDLTAAREREATLAVMQRYLPPGMVEQIHRIAGLALGGERREMTCMFADVFPLRLFSADLRPQQTMELLNAYLTRATDVVHQSKGIIDKYIGTEIMALFNTQLNPNTSHSLQAVLTALDIVDTVLALYDEHGLPLDLPQFRIGIHTGVATLGNVGSQKRRNFTALGDTINLTKRLQENSRPGQILVSEDVLYAAGELPGNVSVTELGAIQVKGRTQQTPIYEVSRHV